MGTHHQTKQCKSHLQVKFSFPPHMIPLLRSPHPKSRHSKGPSNILPNSKPSSSSPSSPSSPTSPPPSSNTTFNINITTPVPKPLSPSQLHSPLRVPRPPKSKSVSFYATPTMQSLYASPTTTATTTPT